MAKNWWDSYASAEEAKDDWWSSYEAVPQGNAGRGVINPPAEAPPRQFVPTARQAAPAFAVPEDYTDVMGNAIGTVPYGAEPALKSRSVLDNLPPVDRTQQPGFMLRPEFVKQVRSNFASVSPEKRRQALIDTASGSDATAQAAKLILADVQKEDKFLQSEEGTRQGMINLVRNAPRVKPAPQLGNQPQAPVVFPDVTPTILERAETYKTPESERIANRLSKDEATRAVISAETGLDALADRVDRESRDFGAEAFAKENPVLAAALSGGKQLVSGIANSLPTVVDFAARLIDSSPDDNIRAPTYQWADEMAKTARSLMPEAGRQNMASAASKGQFAEWLGLNLVSQAPQIAANFAAAVLPPLRPFVLPAMGAQTAGQAYGQGDTSGAALLKGGAEIAGEYATFGIFDRTYAAISKLPLSLQGPTIQSVGRALAASGTAITAQGIGGAIEETTTQILQNGVDRYLQGKDVGLLDGTADAAVLGAVMQGSLSVPLVRKSFQGGESAFAEALAGDVAAAQFAPSALDQYARRALDVQSYDENIIRPGQAARVQQDQADLQSSTTAADAAAAADNLSGSLSELLVPGNAVTPIIPPPDITGTITPPLPGVNLETEQQFGLDKLRINPQPAPVETRTFTAQEMGAMPIRDRRALTNQFDQTENEDGTFTFTAKSGAAPSTQVVPAPGAEQTLGTAPVRDVSNQPVLDDNTVRADAQRSLDDWATKNNQAIPAKLDAAPEAETRAVATVANLLGSQFGTRVVAFHDTQPSAVQGVAVGGTAFVNTANVFTNIAKVSLHELKHTIEQIAFTETKAGLTDTAAQKFTAQIDGIFDDMTDDGKRAYLVNFLHKAELAALDATPDIKESRIQELMQSPVLRSEMTADFMGNRATDKRFWADVAKADPGGFKGFVQKWVSVIDNLMGTLRGKGGQTKTESAKVDQYVRDLAKAKMVAREALIAYRQGTLQQFESAPAASLRQGEVNAQTSVAAGSENLPGATTPSGPGFSEDGGGPVPNYGTARAGAISVLARHYSTTPRQTLSGAYYGQGLKGAERDRLDRSTDPRIKNRVYFYVDQGAGIRPESGVGGYAHEARLDNIYDPQTRLIKPQADSNAFESAVINAGFDGYIAPFGNNQSAVVLLGLKHKAVPVRAIGQPKSAALPAEAAPTTLKKGLLSREASQVDTGNIPGSRMRMGTLEIPAAQVDAANAEMERIGSQIRFSAREVVGPPAPETKDTAVYRDVADKIKLSAAEYNAGMLPLMTGKTGDKTFKTPRIGGVPEVVQWLDQRRAKSGLPKLNINKPEDRTVLAKLLAAEAVAAIRSAGNAVEWYDETVAKTLRIMGVKYPELNTDANARNAFLMATAISSQTMNVEDNLRYASQQYEAFRTTGKFPEVGTGKSAPAMAKNFALANELLADIGPDKLRRFLASTFTKRELELSGFKIGGESMDEKLLGSAVFGPKIGFGFYSNLTGNFEPVTMDMWFMRTVGRLAGTLPAFDPVLFPKQVAKLRAALAETGSADRGVYGSQFDPAVLDAAMKTDEGAIALARQVHSLHNRQFIKERAAFDAGTRLKTALVGAADSIIKSSDKPTDAPASGGERQRLRDVVRQMVDMVEEQTGKRVPPAALQALIWYPEQELYKSLGVKLRVTSQDYAGAAKSLLTKEGFDAKRIDTATKSGPGPARQVAGKPVTGTNQANGRPTGGAVPLKGAERDTFLAERTARANAQVVAAQSLQTIFESLDKRGLAKTRAEAAFVSRPDGAQIKYIQENFNDILIQLEDADKVKINCD